MAYVSLRSNIHLLSTLYMKFFSYKIHENSCSITAFASEVAIVFVVYLFSFALFSFLFPLFSLLFVPFHTTNMNVAQGAYIFYNQTFTEGH